MDDEGIERNTITYNAAISACGKGGWWREALRLLDDMNSAGVGKSDLTFSAAISACEKGGQ